MSTFFTAPASQRKRKRDDANTTPSTKRRNINPKVNAKPQTAKTARARRDESISSAESEDDARRKSADDNEPVSDDESEDADETNAERRLRLAEQYLQNIKGEVEEDVGFDAEEVDRDLIAERLEKDVADTKGRLHKHIASTFDFVRATQTQFRYPTLTTTSIAICPPYAYTVSKDLQLIKWELPYPTPPPSKDAPTSEKAPRPIRRRPTKLRTTKGDTRKHGDPSYKHHTAPILCVAASPTNKFIATGGADKKLIVWSASDLAPLRVFSQHRDAVTSLAFRQGTNQLYSASKDRTIKTWSLDEMAYVETLFGHQDEVVGVAALAQERCVSVGARDRTARLWKVVEETQLVFRGGGSSMEKKRNKKDDDASSGPRPYHEGSIDRVAMVDDEMFVTGSDNGSLSLWSVQKKKPVFTIPLAHGLDPALKPEEVSADLVPNVKIPERQPRWITALATIPLSDLVISGSWDGYVRVWQISEDKRRLERLGVVGRVEQVEEVVDGGAEDERAEREKQKSMAGFVNDLCVFERGEHGNDGLSIVAAIGTEPRLGRWKTIKGKNGAVILEVRKTATAEVTPEGKESQAAVENEI